MVPLAKAIHCSTTAESAPTSSILLSIAILTSTAGTRLGCTSPSIRCPRSMRRGPTILLILPWNLKKEIIAQMRHVGGLGLQVYRADS